MLSLRKKVRKNSSIKLGLASLAALKEILASLIEGTVQQCKKGESLGREDLAVDVVNLAGDGDTLKDRIDGGHCDRKWRTVLGLTDGG
jgi:hypothetical protein